MGVVIGVDPHKRSNTALVVDEQEQVLGRRRFPNDKVGYREMKSWSRTWRQRTWAVEGARGVGLGLAQRLAVEGEQVINVPAKMSAQVRVFGGGSGRKTDDTDAHAVALAGLRAKHLQLVRPDDHVTVIKLLTDRREQLVEQRIATVNRLHDQLMVLVAGGAARRLTASKARTLLASVRPRDEVGKARKLVAVELLTELESLDKRIKDATKRLAAMLEERPSQVQQIKGFGPVNTSVILGEVADVRRFPTNAHFASYTGTAPVDASSGDTKRHRLNRGGNRRLNHALHSAAVVQICWPGPGQHYYRRKLAEGKTPMEALRCLKRRLSDAVFRALLADLAKCEQAEASPTTEVTEEAGPGGHLGATLQSSAASPTPTASSSDKSQPGPAKRDATPDADPLSAVS